MQIIDANVLLRYLLSDHEELSGRAAQIIDNNRIDLPLEVLCEVVYVLEKVYKANRKDICNELTAFINDAEIVLPNRETVLLGLQYYAAKKLDFVDCVLAGYAKAENAEIFTFDEDLKKLIERENALNK